MTETMIDDGSMFHVIGNLPKVYEVTLFDTEFFSTNVGVEINHQNDASKIEYKTNEWKLKKKKECLQ